MRTLPGKGDRLRVRSIFFNLVIPPLLPLIKGGGED
jgi:hypothetical protein